MFGSFQAGLFKFLKLVLKDRVRGNGLKEPSHELRDPVLENQLEILRDQSKANESLEERLAKLEELEEQAMSGPSAKKQRVGRCQNRHHEQVKPHQWLNSRDVVLLKTHALQQHVVETWTGSRYILCGKLSGKHIQANTRSMLWPCNKCNVGTDAAA